jgi:hypothetical protein
MFDSSFKPCKAWSNRWLDVWFSGWSRLEWSAMSYFLVVYDRSTGTVLELKEFQGHQRAEALRARFARELVEHAKMDVEVVLLGAASRNELMHTHSRYFQSAQELVDRAVSELA